MGYSNSIPLVVYGFTDRPCYAKWFETKESAFAERTRLLKRLYDFDGQKLVPKDYLKVVEATLGEVN